MPHLTLVPPLVEPRWSVTAVRLDTAELALDGEVVGELRIGAGRATFAFPSSEASASFARLAADLRITRERLATRLIAERDLVASGALHLRYGPWAPPFHAERLDLDEAEARCRFAHPVYRRRDPRLFIPRLGRWVAV